MFDDTERVLEFSLKSDQSIQLDNKMGDWSVRKVGNLTDSLPQTATKNLSCGEFIYLRNGT